MKAIKEWAMLILVVVLLLSIPVVFIGPWYSTKDAMRALKDASYQNIQIHGHAWFVCKDSDTFATSFTATTYTGVQVEGAVCSGWLHGAVIRL